MAVSEGGGGRGGAGSYLTGDSFSRNSRREGSRSARASVLEELEPQEGHQPMLFEGRGMNWAEKCTMGEKFYVENGNRR